MGFDIHLGLTPWEFGKLDARSLCSQAQWAEALGYESLWLPENHFGENALPDPLTMLAAVAGATERIKLGTTSYLLTLRNPLQAAEQVAVLDNLSGGRLILGVGRGYAPDMLKAFHVPPSQKRRIFAWTLETMQAAWAGEKVSLSGKSELVEKSSQTAQSTPEAPQEEGVQVFPQPVQKPHPPLWVAAFGPKALAQAGRLGLPYLCSPMESLGKLKDNYAAHRQASIDAGVSPPEVVPLMRSVFISEDTSLLSHVRELLAQRSDNPRVMPEEDLDDWAWIGTREQVTARLSEYVEELGMTHLVATRLRVPGLATEDLQASLVSLMDIVRS